MMEADNVLHVATRDQLVCALCAVLDHAGAVTIVWERSSGVTKFNYFDLKPRNQTSAAAVQALVDARNRRVCQAISKVRALSDAVCS